MMMMMMIVVARAVPGGRGGCSHKSVRPS